MKLAVVSFALSIVFSAAAFAQSQTQDPPPVKLLDKLDPVAPDLLKNWSGWTSALKNPAIIATKPFVIVQAKPTACAIPLLNALPAASPGSDFKMRIVKPQVPEKQMAAESRAVGLPACK